VSGPSLEEGIRVVGMLLLIVGGLFVTGRVMRSRRSSQGPIRVLSRLSVAKGAALVIVSVQGRRMLLAAGERGVSLLAELGSDDAEEGDLVDLEPPSLDREETDGVVIPWTRDPVSIGPGTGLVHRLQRATMRRAVPRPSRAQAR
jgi:hypothetical protein